MSNAKYDVDAGNKRYMCQGNMKKFPLKSTVKFKLREACLS